MSEGDAPGVAGSAVWSPEAPETLGGARAGGGDPGSCRGTPPAGARTPLLASVPSRVVCDAPCARVENHPSGTAVTLPAAPSGPSRSRFCSRDSSVVHSFLFPVTRRAVTLPRDDLEGASQVDPWSAPWGDRRAGGHGARSGSGLPVNASRVFSGVESPGGLGWITRCDAPSGPKSGREVGAVWQRMAGGGTRDV